MVLKNGNAPTSDTKLELPWSQVAARGPSYFLALTEGMSVIKYGNSVLQKLFSLSPTEKEDKKTAMRKLGKFAVDVDRLAPPVLLI